MLWISRNKRVIEGIFIRRPVDLIFQCIGFLQRWKILMRTGEQAKLNSWGDQVAKWLEEFQKQIQQNPSTENFM